MFASFKMIIQRDLLCAFRRRSDLLGTLIFFVIVSSLFPLGVGPEPALLRSMAPGILWVAALLSAMLGMNRLFAFDFNDGSLEQLLLSRQPLLIMVLGKIVAHWLVTGLPLVLLAPLLALQFDLPANAIWALAAGLCLGTPVLSLLGAIGAALTLGLNGSGVLLGLLILPLYIPVLIFGSGAVSAEMAGTGAAANLLLLAAMLCAGLAFAPWASAAALRISLE